MVVSCPTSSRSHQQPQDGIIAIIYSPRFPLPMPSGSEKVIVTLGEKGCLLVESSDKELHVPCPQVQAIDTSGGGDAFVGSLAVYLSKGGECEQGMGKGISRQRGMWQQLGSDLHDVSLVPLLLLLVAAPNILFYPTSTSSSSSVFVPFSITKVW